MRSQIAQVGLRAVLHIVPQEALARGYANIQGMPTLEKMQALRQELQIGMDSVE